jgi:hypothetical protein
MLMFRLFVSISLIIAALPAVSKPYMFPDVGTPGFATYVEIVADHDDFDFFSTLDNEVSLNNPGDDLRVQLATPNPNIVIGPVTSSWDGRLITTTIFVSPEYDKAGLDEDWELSDNVLIQVSRNGTLLPGASFDFYIVEPTTVGDPGANTVFGDNIGKMSPKNAIIVDSLLLADNTTYTISTNDPDPFEPGNQAYLPAHILSLGPIIGGTGSVIDVSATGENGGPGGGGGGGQFCDRNALFNAPSGTNGGLGFTGGGAGGQNFQGGSSSHQDAGNGSGEITTGLVGGSSINGVVGGITLNGLYENAGGGTGHPFGSSGIGWNGTGGFEPEGGYGGGSGAGQLSRGGNGSYRDDGNTVGTVTGNIHGSQRLVPLAGGSGGASGNPQTLTGGCAGEGGGGGGAIRLFAESIQSLRVISDGGDGESGLVDGGAGSGGGIELNAKVYDIDGLDQVSARAQGGEVNNTVDGGSGYIKANYQASSVLGDNVYYMTSSDTVKFAKSNFNLRGYKNDGGELTHYSYENNEWVILGNAPLGTNNWTQNIDFPAGQDYMFIASVWDRPSAAAQTQYRTDPQYLLSQAAWNIIRLDLVPDIDNEIRAVLSFVSCQGDELIDSIRVFNEGDADLVIDMAASDFRNVQNFADFEILTTGDLVIPPGETGWIVFRFNNPDGLETDRNMVYRIASNDPDEAVKEYRVRIERRIVDLSYQDENNITLTQDSLYLGEVCLGDQFTGSFYVLNSSTKESSIDYSGDPQLNLQNPNNDLTILTGETLQFDFTVNANQLGDRVLYATVNDVECPDAIDSLALAYRVVDNELTFADPNQQDFGAQLINSPTERTVSVINTGNDTILLNDDPIPPAPEYVFNRYEPFISELLPGDTVNLIFIFTPSVIGDNPVAPFTWQPQIGADLCDVSLDIDLSGEGIDYSLGVSPDVDFGLIYYCEAQDTIVNIWNFSDDEFSIVNQGTPANPEWGIFSGNQFGYYSSTPAFYANDGRQVSVSDNSLGNGDTISYQVRFNPDAAANGIYQSTLEIITTADLNNPIEIEFTAEVDSLQFNTTESDGNNDRVIDFGQIPLGGLSAIQTIEIELLSVLQRGLSFTPDPNNDSDQIINTAFTDGLVISQANPTTSIELQIDAEAYTGMPESVSYDLEFVPQCGESISYTLNFEIIQSNIEVLDIDLGKINKCALIDWDIPLQNFGGVSGRVDSLVNLANAFQRVYLADNIVDEFSQRTVPGGTFDASTFDEGLINQQYRLYTFENGAIDSLDFSLTAEVLKGFSPDTIIVDFGNQVIFQTSVDIEREFSSEVDLDVSTENIILPNTDPGVFDTDLLNLSNQNLNGGTFNRFRTNFTPDRTGSFREEIKIPILVENPDCRDSIIVILTGVGVPGATLSIYTDTDLGSYDPAEDLNVNIPIYGMISNGVSEVTLTSLSGIRVSWNKTLFYPEELQGGQMQVLAQDWNNDREITIEISGTDKTITETESEIFTLIGSPMLGNAEQTAIEIDLTNFEYEPDGIISDLVAENGVLRILPCTDEDGTRLMDYVQPIDITVSVNQNIMSLNAVSPYSGEYAVKVYDIRGSIVFSDKWNSNGRQVYSRDIKLPAISSGMYFVKYTNGRNIIIKKAGVVR